MGLKITPVGDDLIVVDGDIQAEFHPTEETHFLATSYGTLITFIYEGDDYHIDVDSESEFSIKTNGEGKSLYIEEHPEWMVFGHEAYNER